MLFLALSCLGLQRFGSPVSISPIVRVISTIIITMTASHDFCVKKKGPVAFSLSTLRNIICAVLGCCGTEQDFYRRLGLGTVRNLLVSVGF